MSSWSFSSYQVFRSCPRHFLYKHINKFPSEAPPSEYGERGTAIHEAAERYIRGETEELHPNCLDFKEDLANLRERYASGTVSVEEEWAFNSDWSIGDWKTAWLRIKCDAVAHLSESHLAVIDFKTGKRKGNELKHAQQVRLYALAAFIRYPEAQKITVELWYFDQDDLNSNTITRDDYDALFQMFDRVGHEITEATSYPPRPNIESCRFCEYKERCGLAPSSSLIKNHRAASLIKRMRKL
jgi:RecB family exonuclease